MAFWFNMFTVVCDCLLFNLGGCVWVYCYGLVGLVVILIVFRMWCFCLRCLFGLVMSWGYVSYCYFVLVVLLGLICVYSCLFTYVDYYFGKLICVLLLFVLFFCCLIALVLFDVGCVDCYFGWCLWLTVFVYFDVWIGWLDGRFVLLLWFFCLVCCWLFVCWLLVVLRVIVRLVLFVIMGCL